MKCEFILEVADSQFLGFVQEIQTRSDAYQFQTHLKICHPNAAHFPMAYSIFIGEKDDTGDTGDKGDTGNVNSIKDEHPTGYEEDGEPPHAVGPVILKTLQTHLDKRWTMTKDNKEHNVHASPSNMSLVICIVRYFGHQLLGVSCGRLSQCYASTCQLALHRFYDYHQNDMEGIEVTPSPMIQEFLHNESSPSPSSLYGLCAGDTELLFNVLPPNNHNNNNNNNDNKNEKEEDFIFQSPNSYLNQIRKELEFNAFKGSIGENLPRLQNLQADVIQHHKITIIPIYRYPGNYNGDEWNTFVWSPTSKILKHCVEQNLRPLIQQNMNHCVTNYYRHGHDHIDHHSDKTLDLHPNGVIVSLSLGDDRIMEFKRRAIPHDIVRIRLPHGSMLLMGPKTNQQFTHSILANPKSIQPRISLTFRNVTTFMELQSGILFGQGVAYKSWKDAYQKRQKEDLLFLLGFGTCVIPPLFRKDRWWNRRMMGSGTSLSSSSLSRWNLNLLTKSTTVTITLVSLLFLSTAYSYRMIRKHIQRHHEETLARAFFSKSSIRGTKY